MNHTLLKRSALDKTISKALEKHIWKEGRKCQWLETKITESI